MKTIPNKLWAEARIYSPAQNLEVLEALMRFNAIVPNDKASILLFYTSDATMLMYFHNDTLEKAEAFQSFSDIPFTVKLLEPESRTVYGLIQALAHVMSAETQL